MRMRLNSLSGCSSATLNDGRGHNCGVMKFTHVDTRKDCFESRYFDFQRSHKYVVELADQCRIETTAYEHELYDKRTDLAIDISTMVGCPMECAFCASASILFRRKLTVDEIVGQARHMIDVFGSPELKQITCSFQGIGEPSAIPDEIICASRCLLDLDERVVVSLSTIAAKRNGLEKIAGSGIEFENFQLTMGGTDIKTVASLMPRAPVPAELACLARDLTERPNLRKVKVNYLLMRGRNDREQDLQFLIREFEGSRVVVKFSYLNETASSTDHRLVPAESEDAHRFTNALLEAGIDSFVFGSFRNIGLSCGQLLLLERE